MASLLEAARDISIDTDLAVSNLPCDEGTLKHHSTRLSWNEVCCIFEGLQAAGLTAEDCDHMGRSMTRSKYLLGPWLAGFGLRAEHFYYLGINWIAPRIFPVVEHSLVRRGRHLTVTVQVPGHFAPCYPFFAVSLAFVSQVPVLIGQPRPEVTSQLTPHGYEAEISLGPQTGSTLSLDRIVGSAASFRYLVSSFRSQKKTLEEALRRSDELEQQFLQTIDGFRDAVFVARDSEILHANPAALALLGFAERGEDATILYGRSIHDFCFAPDLPRVKETFRSGGEFRMVRLDQSLAVVNMPPCQPVYFDNRGAHMWVLRDVSEQRRQQEKLAAADRITSMAMLSASLAHEINNPLTLTLTNLQMIHRAARSRGDAALERQIESAIEGASRIRDITSDLARFTSADSGETLVDVADVLRSTVRLATVDQKSEVFVRLDVADSPLVLGSLRSLGQIVLNLVLNAKQASLEATDSLRTVDVRLRSTEDHVRVEVEDQAGGIDPELLEHVFEPFYSTRETGSGLGLAVSRSLAQELGGSVVLETTESGTLAVLTLPRARSRQPRFAGKRATSRPRALRLLVIDDEKALVRTLSGVFHDHFDEVVCAESGNQAIKLLEEDDGFDAILCDLAMPDGDGVEVRDFLAKNRPRLLSRTLFMSGGTPSTRAAKLIAANDRPLLQKPFADIDELCQTLLQVATQDEGDEPAG